MNLYERSHNLPHNYLNAAVTATGPEGAFQRLERGELPLDEFYGQFGRELGSVESGNKAYREYCRRTGIGTSRFCESSSWFGRGELTPPLRRMPDLANGVKY